MNPDEALIALHELESHFLRQALHYEHRARVSSIEERLARIGQADAYEAAAYSVRRTIQQLSDAETVIRMKDSEHE